MVHLKRILCLFIVVFISLIFVTPWNLPFSRPAPAPEPTPAPTPMPTPEVTPVPFADGFDLRGTHYSIDVTELDLSGLSESDSADIETFCRVAPYANNLKNVNLGNETSSPVNWNMIAQLQEAAPDVHFSYSFSLYGEPMTLDTEYIDLRKIPVDDNGAAVVSALPCMKKCTTLDMDQSGVDSEHMAMIRDSFPNVKVIWRVWFSILDYSCRTDAKTILCSLAGDSGLTDEESCKPLTYCTEVVNLDVGHNNHMRTLSFLRYMPNLEIFITYNNYLRDVDDLAYCKKLRYVELYGSSMYNINSIAELYELTSPLTEFRKLNGSGSRPGIFRRSRLMNFSGIIPIVKSTIRMTLSVTTGGLSIRYTLLTQKKTGPLLIRSSSTSSITVLMTTRITVFPETTPITQLLTVNRLPESAYNGFMGD